MIKINGKQLELINFPNGETRIKLPEELDFIEIIVIDWKFKSDAELFQLMCVVDAYAGYCDNMILTLPYIPYSRMDRVEDSVTLFTLKTFCNIINDMNFDKVYILEPHSDVCVALLNSVEVLSVTKSLVKQAMDDIGFNQFTDYIYYPDLTAYRRYSKMFPKFKYLIGLKKRDFDSGEITGLQIVGDVPSGKFDVIMIDDLCSKGGSFVFGAEELKKLGMEIFSLVVSHCEDTVFNGVLLDREDFGGIYTTDSILTKKHDKIYCKSFEDVL